MLTDIFYMNSELKGVACIDQPTANLLQTLLLFKDLDAHLQCAHFNWIPNIAVISKKLK